MADTDETHNSAFQTVADGLFQPEKELFIAPIRHHSPACAWALRALIRELRPRAVLIEAPIDFEAQIELLLDRATKPPVAIAALIERPVGEQGPAECGGPGHARLAAYYPFCAHSPEFVALRVAHAVDADAQFIDLPAGAKALLRPRSSDRPIPLADEPRFDAGGYVAALASKLGCRDGYELWDHLFETRVGQSDWRGFFRDVAAYCAGVRAATPEAELEAGGDFEREAHMAARVFEALQNGGPVVVVVGGFHAPALIARLADEAIRETPNPAPPARHYLIRYSFAALDVLNGYAAGLPQPGWYDGLWRAANTSGGPPNWRDLAVERATGFACRMRAQGAPIAVPAQVEMLRVAESLARLRGRPGALRHDLIDGLRAALLKGEGVGGDVWTDRFLADLRGDALGDVPASAGSPPLVEDARRRANANRLDIQDGARRRRKLDIRRKPAHLAASQFLQAMTLLETGFAVREIGPDYLNDARTDLLFEEWSYAWSPQVEGRLIERAAAADQVPGACLAELYRRRREILETGHGDDLDAMLGLFAHGLLAGLGARLGPYLTAVASDIQSRGEFAAVARALRRLHRIAIARGPLAPPPALDLDGVRQASYLRLVFLCDDLPRTRPEAIGERLTALRLVADLLRGPENEAFDRALFDAALDRVSRADPPPEILGAALAVAVFATAEGPVRLLTAVEGRLHGAVPDQADRIGVLRGLLSADPTLLWRVEGLLDQVDGFLLGLDENAFLELLPHLRLAFTALSPRETDQVAARLANRHGASAGAFAQQRIAASEQDLTRGAEIERRLAASIRADGLQAWLRQGAS